jgi:hypothetical protein
MLRMVNDSNDDGRWYPFRVIVGLMEGYGEGATLHLQEEVEGIVGSWSLECRANNLPELQGMFSPKTMVYARRSDGKLLREPVVVFEGEANPMRIASDVTELQYIKAFWVLAEHLAEALNQTRIYIRFNQRTIVLEEVKQ